MKVANDNDFVIMKGLENEHAILDDFEQQVIRKINRYSDSPDFPCIADYNYTYDDLSEYLFNKQVILDSGGSVRSQFTTFGILMVIPVLLLSTFPEKSLPWGQWSLFVGIAFGVLLGLIYKLLLMLFIKVRLHRMSEKRMEEYLDKVIQYKE